jgi:WD40 repeat protein
MGLIPQTVRGTIARASAVWLTGTTFLWLTLPPRPRAAIASPQQWVAGFSPDGQTFLTTANSPWQDVEVHSTADAKARSQFAVGAPGMGPAVLSHDGRLLAFPTKLIPENKLIDIDPKSAVVVWDIEAGRERFRLDGAEGPITFAPDGRLAATGDASFFGTVRVWDLTVDLPLSRSLCVSPGLLGSLGFAPDGRHLVAAGNQLTSHVLLMSEFAGSHRAPRPPASPLLPNGGVVWWATEDWHEAGRLANAGPSLLDSAAAFATDDRLAVVRNDLPRVARIIDVATGANPLAIPIPPGASNLEPAVTGSGGVGVLYYRDDFTARVLEWMPRWVSGQGRARYLPTTVLYDAETGAERAQVLLDPRHAFLSPDGRTLGSWEDGKLTVWDVPPSRFTMMWAALSATLGIPILALVRWRIRVLSRIIAETT